MGSVSIALMLMLAPLWAVVALQPISPRQLRKTRMATSQQQRHRPYQDSSTHLSMSISFAAAGAAPSLVSTLKRTSKVLTVGIEYAGGGDILSDNEISILSMQLRKSKVSAIWCADRNHAEEFAKEQSSALGDFPGPCPVIYYGPTPQEGGVTASAIVLSAGDDVPDDDDSTTEIIWKVSSPEEVASIIERTDNGANAFWVVAAEAGDAVQEIIQSLPESALCIAAVNSMQPDGAEIQRAKDLKKLGVNSILVIDACVGDSEDVEYTNFVVSGMTSKASSEFSFSGLTGSTNGHFGGVQARGTVKWQRSSD